MAIREVNNTIVGSRVVDPPSIPVGAINLNLEPEAGIPPRAIQRSTFRFQRRPILLSELTVSRVVLELIEEAIYSALENPVSRLVLGGVAVSSAMCVAFGFFQNISATIGSM